MVTTGAQAPLSAPAMRSCADPTGSSETAGQAIAVDGGEDERAVVGVVDRIHRDAVAVGVAAYLPVDVGTVGGGHHDEGAVQVLVPEPAPRSR